MTKYLRFRDLKECGLVSNWPTLTHWIQTQGFPPGILLGPNTRAWPEDEIADWIERRRALEAKSTEVA